jgi:hypothetical protein
VRTFFSTLHHFKLLSWPIRLADLDLVSCMMSGLRFCASSIENIDGRGRRCLDI